MKFYTTRKVHLEYFGILRKFIHRDIVVGHGYAVIPSPWVGPILRQIPQMYTRVKERRAEEKIYLGDIIFE